MTSQIPFGDHLTDDQLARPFDTGREHHLAGCSSCQARRAEWQRMAVAARQVSDELAGVFSTPSFDDLLGDAPGMPWAAAAETVRPGPTTSARLTAALVRAQLRLMPRLLLPLTLAGFLGCLLLAIRLGDADTATTSFGLAVTLIFQFGTLLVCAPSTGPRSELGATLPIPAAAVFAGRLTVVLIADTALALIMSIAASELGVPANIPEMIAGWLGPAMFASALGVLFAVWQSVAVGAVAGSLAWLLGASGSFAGTGPLHRIGTLIMPLWSTTLPTLVLAVALLLAAVVLTGRPRYRAVAG